MHSGGQDSDAEDLDNLPEGTFDLTVEQMRGMSDAEVLNLDTSSWDPFTDAEKFEIYELAEQN